MTFLREKAAVICRAMSYPESWRLPARVAMAMARSLSGLRPATADTGTILYVNSPPVESPAFRRYLAGLTRMARGDNVPLVVHLAITDRCGYKCERCSNKFMRTVSADPSFEQLAGLLGELKRAGTATIAFTGGEPTLRPDLCRLVETCGPEMAPILFTSGQGVDRETARGLRSAGLVMAVVSMDSRREAVHDAIRGQPGAWRQAVEAIRLFLGQGVYTAAQAVADSGLRSAPAELEKFLRFAGELGVHEVVLLDPMALGSAGDGGSTGARDRERLKALPPLSASRPNMPKVTTAACLESAEQFGCLAGYSFFYIGAGGGLCPCDFVPMSFGNVFEMGFAAAFDRARTLVRRSCTNCLSDRMRVLWERPPAFPLEWEQTREVFPRLERGAPAAMMKAIAN